MNAVSKTLILAGLILIVTGVLWHFGSKVFPVGRLPGDITVEKENFKFYFPIMSSLILSAALSLIIFLIRFFTK
ncbi:MAG: DUF2905 domain-containing protein [Oligoflexia bacterium]|nr:DUF2905 domain-containing protein [Oligoflexia bacterium]